MLAKASGFPVAYTWYTEEQERDLWRQFCLILDGKDRSALTQ
jgi:hypothetical protein